MKKKGRLTKKNKSLGKETYEESNVPRSFVIHNGLIGAIVKNLISDFKRVMKPNTAVNIRSRKKSTLNTGLCLKISRLPQGPTLTFRIENFCLIKDVISSQTKQMVDNKHSLYAPCLMTNLQPSEGEQHLQLCSKMFLDMFPTISPSNIKPSHINRCCLIHYDDKSSNFEFRHYAIKVKPVGISKATRKLLSNKVPNLSLYQEVSDFVVKDGPASESEGEDEPSNQILVDKKRKGQNLKHQSNVKLAEIGPRLKLKLLKIEAGLCEGTVLHHSYITVSAEEKLIIARKKEKQRKLKLERQKEQMRNIRAKEQKHESHRQKCLKGMGINASSEKRTREEMEADDDAQYFREEVGTEPAEELFSKKAEPEKTNYYKRVRVTKKNAK